jgi:hypothetical protein
MAGAERTGGHCLFVWGVETSDKKKNVVALDGCWAIF